MNVQLILLMDCNDWWFLMGFKSNRVKNKRIRDAVSMLSWWLARKIRVPLIQTISQSLLNLILRFKYLLQPRSSQMQVRLPRFLLIDGARV